MLLFLDESFRERGEIPFGVLAGIAIPETQLTRVAKDVFQLKWQHLGEEFARDGEMKGKDLLKRYAFRIEEHGTPSKNLALARDLLNYVVQKKLQIFGCVCFQDRLHQFKCQDVTALDKTFRFLFERIDIFMKIRHPGEIAALVFDDRDHGTNLRNATAITNFFLRSPHGLALDSVLDTPFFAISQAQNIGLQLADFVTTLVAMRFEGREEVKGMYNELQKVVFRWEDPPGVRHGSLKIIRSRK